MTEKRLCCGLVIATFIVLIASCWVAGSPLFAKDRSKIDIGILAQREFISNSNRINKLSAEIKKIEKRTSELLTNLLEANNVVLKKNELCRLDFKTWTLSFKERGK